MKKLAISWAVPGLLCLAMLGCGGGGDNSGLDDPSVINPPPAPVPNPPPAPVPNPPPPPIGGGEVLVPLSGETFAQKGPFQVGAQVLAEELDIDNDGIPTGRTFTTTTDVDGRARFTGIDWDSVAMVTVEGHFFNEVSGQFSDDPLRLRAMMRVGADSPPANINLFTHLVARYIEYWMADGWEYTELQDYAFYCLNDWFGLKTNPDQLNLLDNRGSFINRDSQVLLLFSAAAASLGMTQEQLDLLADEFATNDACYEQWPDDSPALALLQALFDEARNNGDSLYTVARQNLEAQYGRIFPANNFAPFMASGGYCGFAEVLCTDTWLESVPVQNGVTKEIPVRSGVAGSYGILARHRNSSGLSFRFAFPSGSAVHSWSAGSNSFTEQVIRPLPGSSDWLLQVSSALDQSIDNISMRRLSDGLPSEPAPLTEGDNEAFMGVVWGTFDNTNSYYQLLVEAGTYEVTVSGHICGQSFTPMQIWGYYWEHDMSAPLPPEAADLNPFENNGELQYASGSENIGCSKSFTLTAPGTQPNRLYIRLKAEALRDQAINSNRDIRHEFNIRVQRQ